MGGPALAETFGNIDVYLFDQLLKGRITPGMRVVDMGCGGGRNLVYLLRQGFDVRGSDQNPKAIRAVRRMAAELRPELEPGRFRVDRVEAPSFAAASGDVVICNAVLHFARDRAHFDAMVDGLWRILAPGGLLFCRLASSVGLEGRTHLLGSGRHLLPDGSERFLTGEQDLLDTTQRLGGLLLDPLKATVVQGLRAMGTWVVAKPPGSANSLSPRRA